MCTSLCTLSLQRTLIGLNEMRKNLLLIVLATLLYSTVQAQTTSSNQGGSRLNTAYKKTSTLNKAVISRQPTLVEYKPLSLQKPLAVNNYYRTLFFANSALQTSSAPQAKESSIASPSAAIPSSVERRIPQFEEKTVQEDQLFVNEKITVSNVYPNPASEYAELDYTVLSGIRDARIVINNVLGSVVAEYSLDRNSRKLRINTRELPSGIYFYQLSLDGRKVATKKMLVRHQQ